MTAGGPAVPHAFIDALAGNTHVVEEKGLPKDFAGRVGAMTKHIVAIEALREMLSELNAEVSKRAGQL
jgi:hypothetical protein